MRRPYKLPEPLLCDADAEITIDLINDFIAQHEERLPRYKYLEKLYKGFHDIFNIPEKPDWKPDNRLAIGFPRYITDTFLGYGYGIPIKRSHPEEAVEDALSEFDRNNSLADHDFEMAKGACIYGHSFEYFYQDEDAQTRVVRSNPKHTFIVYDDTVRRRAMFAIRFGYKNEGMIRVGELLTRDTKYNFDGKSLDDGEINPYGRIPIVEWALNEERIGLYEEVAGSTEIYNKTIGEKANDVDAFAEAYLAVLGAELDEEGIYRIRDNRVINLYGTNDAKDILVQFLQKPTADGSQENLLNRLEKLIYQTSMVANISDQDFGTSSGIALAYKLQPTSNLAATFNRKIQKSMGARYKIFCSLSTNVSNKDAWRDIGYTFTPNIPKNTLEEAQTAQALAGIVSEETQLKVLSIVDNVADEIKKIEKEQEKKERSIVDQRMFTGGDPVDQQGVLEQTGGGAVSAQPQG